MNNDAYDPHRFIVGIAGVSRTDNQTPNPDSGIGRECYAFSEQEARAHELAERTVRGILRNHREGIDFSIDRDVLGTLFVTFFGSDRTLLPFMVHSHLDSVQDGGMYDGVAGVAVAFGVLDRLVKSTRPRRSLLVGVYVAEESSPRNGIACLGSAFSTGTIAPEKLDRIMYEGATKLSDHLGNTRWRLVHEHIRNPRITPQRVSGSFEVHIEQSAVIARSECDVGVVVDGIGGAVRRKFGHAVESEPLPKTPCAVFEIHTQGDADHSGGTPPNEMYTSRGTLHRKDALVASSYAVQQLLKCKGAMLLSSEPEKDEGFSSVPDWQIARVAIPVADSEEFALRSEKIMQCAEKLFGVTISISPFSRMENTDATRFVPTAVARRYLNIAPSVSAISTRALRRGSAEFGTTRATVVAFRLDLNGVSFKLDLREVNHDDFAVFERAVMARIERSLGRGSGSEVSAKKSQPVDSYLTEELESTVKRLGVSYVKMPSLPGHDSDRHAEAGIPVAMLFLRQDDGVSHSPYERLEKSHFDSGYRVAMEFVLDQLKR